MIGKLCLHINNYSESEDFYVSPLQKQVLILRAQWFHKVYACLQFLEKVVTFRHFGKYCFKVDTKGNTIPIVSNNAFKKVMKKFIFT